MKKADHRRPRLVTMLYTGVKGQFISEKEQCSSNLSIAAPVFSLVESQQLHDPGATSLVLK